MKIVIGRFNAVLTISAELKKMLLLYRGAFLLSLPKRTRLFFLVGLVRQYLSLATQITVVIRQDKDPDCRSVLETVCQPIVKTGPPLTAVHINNNCLPTSRLIAR